MAKRITIIALVIGTAGLFIDPINDLVTSEISTNLLIPTFLIYFTFIFVTKSIEKYKHANNKELKIEDYYQEVSKEDLIGLIKDWTDLLNDTSLKMYLMKEEAKKDIPKPLLKKNDEDKTSVVMQDGNEYEKVDATTVAMGKLIMATWIYGKKQTSKLLANYQQHNFKEIPETNDEIYRHNTKSLVYVAKIITSLRKDLMNYEVETMDLLKLKINDIYIQDNYKTFEQLIQEVEEETK